MTEALLAVIEDGIPLAGVYAWSFIEWAMKSYFKEIRWRGIVAISSGKVYYLSAFFKTDSTLAY